MAAFAVHGQRISRLPPLRAESGRRSLHQEVSGSLKGFPLLRERKSVTGTKLAVKSGQRIDILLRNLEPVTDFPGEGAGSAIPLLEVPHVHRDESLPHRSRP